VEIEPDDLVLVAVMPSPRDFEITRILGWYRIPLQTAPRTLHVDWIAFYLTGAFGPDGHAVRHVARVLGVELVPRAELLLADTDHPRAGDPYFQVQVGPLVPLGRPIVSRRWRRFTFLYTTGERLLAAGELKDLTLRSARQRSPLARRVRERGPGECGARRRRAVRGSIGRDDVRGR
jgi:hypothetical protein